MTTQVGSICEVASGQRRCGAVAAESHYSPVLRMLTPTPQPLPRQTPLEVLEQHCLMCIDACLADPQLTTSVVATRGLRGSCLRALRSGASARVGPIGACAHTALPIIEQMFRSLAITEKLGPSAFLAMKCRKLAII